MIRPASRQPEARASRAARRPGADGDELVAQYVRRQLASILEIVSLNFGSLGECPQDMHGVGRFEPRIEYIARQLGSLWSFLPASRAPTSFFLKRLSHWLVRADDAPHALNGYTAVLQYLSATCGADCEFCLHKGDPPGRWTKGRQWQRSPAEVRARLRHYRPDKGTSLFQTQDYSFYEITTHPEFLATLRELRERTSEPIAFTTNGSALTREFVEKLAALRPVHLMVSLNSADAATRGEMMHEADPHVGIACLEHLQRARISYSVSAVPYDYPQLDGLGDTIRYAEACGAYLIRVNVPGYSRWFAGPPYPPEEAREFWQAVVRRVEELRESVRTPLVFQPSHIDLGAGRAPSARAEVAGVIRKSPADEAGLRLGDTIVSVDDSGIESRSEAIRVLALYRALRIDRPVVRFERGGEVAEVELREQFGGAPDGSRYPHFSHLRDGPTGIDFSFPYGIVLQPTFDPDWLLVAREMIERSGARDALLMASELLQPVVAALVAERRPFEGLDADVRLAVPRNEHFLGGDIAPGDLLVAQDFAACIREQPARPDLALIPATAFSPWGRDISNTSYLEIERATGVPVELVPCQMVSVL